MLSAKSAADLDYALFREFPLGDLMDIAGKVVYSIARELFAEKSTLVVACGPGNNGGDALVAARLLAAEFSNKTVLIYAPRTKFPELLQTARAFSNVRLIVYLLEAPAYSGLIDGIFGFSQRLPLIEPYASAVAQFCSFDVVSIDVPTGYSIDAPTTNPPYTPLALISLTAPKRCHEELRHRGTRCFVGGNFCSDELACEFGIHGVKARFPSYHRDAWFEDE